MNSPDRHSRQEGTPPTSRPRPATAHQTRGLATRAGNAEAHALELGLRLDRRGHRTQLEHHTDHRRRDIMRPRVRYWLPGRFALALARATDALWQRWIVPHSITCLRVSMGIVFVLFGALKFFPGVSPVEDLVEATTAMLTLGVVHGGLALPLVATIECAIGLALLTGRAMRGAMYLLAGHMIGILSPVVLMPGRLFAGPHGTPTLEGQYIVKDIILVGATLVLATTLGGARASAQQRHAPSVADSYDCDEISYS